MPYEKLSPTEHAAAQAAHAQTKAAHAAKGRATQQSALSRPTASSADPYDSFIQLHLSKQILLTSVPENHTCYFAKEPSDDDVAQWAERGFLGL